MGTVKGGEKKENETVNSEHKVGIRTQQKKSKDNDSDSN